MLTYFVDTHVYVCAGASLCVCPAYVHGSQRSTLDSIPQESSIMVFFPLTGTQGSLIRLGEPANEPWASFLLYLSSAGVVRM